MRCNNDRYDQITEDVYAMGLDELCTECIRRGILRDDTDITRELVDRLISDMCEDTPEPPAWMEDDGYKVRNREN